MPTEPCPASTGATVLVLDDEPAICSWIARILARVGLTVLSAENGSAGLALLAAERQPVALLIVDVKLPDMSGREFVHHAAARFGTRPVLYISGVKQECRTDALHTRTIFLAKPFEPADLIGRVQQLLGESSGHAVA